ncbi:MAG: type II toxin-antitoxin system RelE family toxin [Thermoleophilaceae bacterium]
MIDRPWRARVTGPARRQLARLPEPAAAAVLETIQTIAANPRRLGKPLTRDLEGLYSARRGPYRVIYELDETAGVVRVVAIGHRRDIYRGR